MFKSHAGLFIATVMGLAAISMPGPMLAASARRSKEDDTYFHGTQPDDRGRRAEKDAIAQQKAAEKRARRAEKRRASFN